MYGQYSISYTLLYIYSVTEQNKKEKGKNEVGEENSCNRKKKKKKKQLNLYTDNDK